MNKEDSQFLIETLCEDLVPMIMKEYNITATEALDKLYKSQTFAKIEDPQTGLYYQGSIYVFDFFKEEFSQIR